MKLSFIGLLLRFTVSVSAAASLLFVDVLKGLEYSQAQSLNASTMVVNTTQWSAMSTADFASYDAVIIGDPF